MTEQTFVSDEELKNRLLARRRPGDPAARLQDLLDDALCDDEAGCYVVRCHDPVRGPIRGRDGAEFFVYYKHARVDPWGNFTRLHGEIVQKTDRDAVEALNGARGLETERSRWLAAQRQIKEEAESLRRTEAAAREREVAQQTAFEGSLEFQVTRRLEDFNRFSALRAALRLLLFLVGLRTPLMAVAAWRRRGGRTPPRSRRSA